MATATFATSPVESAGDRLVRVARQSGFRRTRRGLWGLPGCKLRWELRASPRGWLEARCQSVAAGGEDPLAANDESIGPVKWLADGEQVVQRMDLMLSEMQSGLLDAFVDEDSVRQRDEVLAGVLEQLPEFFAKNSKPLAAWEPPPAERISGRLAALAVEAAIDKEGDLRFAIKRRGCDGQVRVQRRTGRLRFVMPLGRWKNLDDAARDALLALGHAANAHCRLTRIAWVEEDGATRCEAQVDLTGLPAPEGEASFSRASEAMWKAMVQMTVSGLELALRRLGLEMPALADPKNREVAEALSEVI